MLDPVVYSSLNFIKLNPSEDHKINSSAILDKFTAIKLRHDKNSIAKSRLETESLSF